MSRGRYYREALEFARVLTFFDAIFAFAVTLLITTIDDFSPEAWSGPGALWEANGSSLTAFAISFVVVVNFWSANHRLMSGLRAVDHTVITMTCAVMFGIVLIPFTTEAIGKPALEDSPLPLAVYAVVISLTYLLHFAVLLTADRRGLAPTRRTRQQIRRLYVQFAVLPAVFLLSIPVAYLADPRTAQGMWLSLLLLIPAVKRLTGPTESATSHA